MAEGRRRTSSVDGLWIACRAGGCGARARHNAASSTLLRRCTHVRTRCGPHHSPPTWSRPITSRMGHGPAYVQRSFRPFCRGTCSRPKSTLFGGALAEPKSPSNSPAQCAEPHGDRPRSSVTCRKAVAAMVRSGAAVRVRGPGAGGRGALPGVQAPLPLVRGVNMWQDASARRAQTSTRRELAERCACTVYF